MNRQIKIFLFSFFIFLLTFTGIKAQSAYEVTREMFNRTKTISTLKYEMKKLERIDGVMIEQRSYVKINRSPLKVYVKQLYPKEGVEVLFALNQNNNMALVNPNGFPWFNLSLDPLGSIIRKNQHHTLLQAGFDHVVNILEFLFDKYDDKILGMVTLLENTEWDGRDCYVIKFKSPYFKYITYAVEKGENIDSIAKKFMISQHMIVELNKNISNWQDVKEGQQITIPNDYSPEMILFIDSKEFIPLVMKVYDDKGLYEHYAYTDVRINPTILPEEFTSEFDDYGF